MTAALKTAKLATGKPGVVAFEGGYHGLGYGPLAACGSRQSWRAAFADQLNPHVTFAPYPARQRRSRLVARRRSSAPSPKATSARCWSSPSWVAADGGAAGAFLSSFGGSRAAPALAGRRRDLGPVSGAAAIG